MWVPTLLSLKGESDTLHTGLVFSSFMLAMTFGGMFFSLTLQFVPSAEALCALVYVAAAAAMATPVFIYDFNTILVAFLVLEMMVGMFSSCGGTLRSRHYPEHMHSSVMSVFRLPLNVLVVLGTTFADHAVDAAGRQLVFLAITVTLAFAAALQVALALFYGESSAGSNTFAKTQSQS